ncbi:MAG: type 2 lanthipeptide synthetase LanM [Candidatus Sericytochromatia bacterium]
MAVRFTERDILVGDRPGLVLGGEFQYFRIAKALWRPSLEKLKAGGLTSISAYVPWIWHEIEEGHFDFTGRTDPARDLAGFMALCEELDLPLVIKPGPFIFAEYQGFGVPHWLRENHPECLMHVTFKPQAYPQPSLNHPGWLALVKIWFEAVADQIRPYIERGSVIAIQIDNETGYPQFGQGPHLTDRNPETMGLFREAIAERLAPGAALGRIAAVRGGLSDAHAGGRTVHRLQTESGLTLIYKPRSMGLDGRFDDLLGWLVAEGLSLDLRPTARLDRGAWGWVECLEHAPCADVAAVGRYFRRAGMLLAVVYALKGMDFHAENLFAVGEHPVLIDLEGLLQPRLDEHAPPDAPFTDAAAFARSLETSVLNTAMVTFPVPAGGQEQDWSGLADPIDAAQSRQRAWVDVNTDRMRLEDVPHAPAWQNLPRLDGLARSARPHAHEVVAGFAEAHALIAARLDRLTAADGPLMAFADQPVRFFFRTTRHYAQLLSRARRPEFLTDGLDRSLVFDRLSRTYRRAVERPARWALIRAEGRALEQSDLPTFATTPGAAGLLADGSETVPFATPALTDVVAHLRRLGPADGRLQARLTAMCLVPAAPAPSVPWPSAADADFQAHGLALARLVAERAVVLEDGSACWLAHHRVSERPVPMRAPLGAGLWDGAGGVALLLGAAHRLAPDPAMRDLALAAVAPMRASLVGHAARGGLWPTDVLPTVGGAIEGLARLSVLLEAPELARDATAIARHWGPGVFARAAHPDVSGGLAAVLRGLLAVYGASGDAGVLAAATAAGDRLLAMAPVGADGLRRWPAVTGRPLAGFAHGASGVASALLRLYEASGEARFLQAAREGLAYEDRVFDAVTGNWPSEPRGPGVEPVRFVSWCYGAPGVALARLVALPHMPERAGEVETAVATTLSEPDHALDFVCCGNFGRVEALLEAGRILDRPEWVLAARRLAARRLPLVGLGPGAVGSAAEGDSTYLRGAAGIGYALLRLAAPGALPCVLTGA